MSWNSGSQKMFHLSGVSILPNLKVVLKSTCLESSFRSVRRFAYTLPESGAVPKEIPTRGISLSIFAPRARAPLSPESIHTFPNSSAEDSTSLNDWATVLRPRVPLDAGEYRMLLKEETLAD
ncbi:unnamed protein product [Timema podura]|uniref:Uncharacterized protein n=1 Tax=Timema podura TaxID=61482 RepID=A0ABN7NT58_TIMPD|nr:unnamed protein product [Timema podura]